MIWKRIVISSDSPFFPVFQQIIKEVKPGQDTIIKNIINKKKSKKIREEVIETYKFDFTWQEDDESICGVEVYKGFKNE
ncbi:MAG: hypothetical protein ACOC5T_08640 [Elusimicrobiota bacterium]